MKVPTTEAVPVVDTGDNLCSYTLQNNGGNDIWISMNDDELNTTMGNKGIVGVAPTDGDAIKMAANGGSITIHFFSGKVWARSTVATTNLGRFIARSILP